MKCYIKIYCIDPVNMEYILLLKLISLHFFFIILIGKYYAHLAFEKLSLSFIFTVTSRNMILEGKMETVD